MRAATKHDHRQAAKAAINKTRKALGLAALEFPEWLPAVTPQWTWNWPHQKYLYEKLDMVTRGICKRMMIFMPPRHTKTETVTVRYGAYRLEQNPKLNIILGCYNQKLANRFSRKTLRIAKQRIALSNDRKAVEEWETAIGGGLRAVGVGGGITGFGGDLIMIDEPTEGLAPMIVAVDGRHLAARRGVARSHPRARGRARTAGAAASTRWPCRRPVPTSPEPAHSRHSARRMRTTFGPTGVRAGGGAAAPTRAVKAPRGTVNSPGRFVCGSQ